MPPNTKKSFGAVMKNFLVVPPHQSQHINENEPNTPYKDNNSKIKKCSKCCTFYTVKYAVKDNTHLHP